MSLPQEHVAGKNMPKVFGIGFGRTGTKSLASAMAALGYDARHGVKGPDDIQRHEFCSDIAVTWRYKFLDYIYPKAKFILTVRETDSWLDSTRKHSKGRNGGPLRRLENRYWLYGICHFDERIMREAFINHQDEVLKHFATRPRKLLIMDICGGDSWEQLCCFLEKPVPQIPFPHKHA